MTHTVLCGVLLRDLGTGGIQASATKIINGLREDISVVLLTKPTVTQAIRSDVKISCLAPNAEGRQNAFLQLLSAAIGASRLIRQEQLQVLLTFGFSMHVVGNVANLLAGRRCRLIHCVRNSIQELESAGQRRLMSTLSRWSLRQADLVIVNSHALMEEACRMGVAAHKLVIIHNGYDLGKLASLSSAPLTDPRVRNSFVFVGRLSQQKNLDLLLHGFELLVRTHEATLTLVGGGDQEAHVKALIAKLGLDGRVLLMGEQSNPYPYIRSALALVLTSHFEGFPNVLVEAMACGVPVISVDCPHGPREILSNGGGVLIESPTAEALCSAMSALLDQPALRNRLADETSSVARRYTLTNMLNGFRRAIHEGAAK